MPVCPECAADDVATPDAWGVHSCSACGSAFRPPGRVPIRRAGSSDLQPTSNTWSWLVAWAIGLGLVAALFLVDREPSSDPLGYEYRPIPIEIPTFEPITLEGLAPLAPVVLAHEVHLSRVVDGRLLATGLLRNDEASELVSVALELRFLDAEGASLGTRVATVACPRLAAHESCAWALDASIPAGMADLEFSASGQRNLIGDVFPVLELHRQFDEAGQPVGSGDTLELDLHERTVRVRVPKDTRLFDVWATLTVLDAEGRVLDVLETRFAESLHGSTVLSIAIPQHESARYDLRVGGSVMATMLSVPHAPEQPG
jgi:hypothetical protein